jgi:ketosteroid isomerase-like protein
MSRENMELVQGVYDAAGRRESAAVLALYDSNVELDGTRLGVVGSAGSVFYGHEGLRTFFREWNEAWESVDYRLDDLIDAGREQVVSVVTRHGRGRSSGAEVEIHVALLWTIRDGKVIRVVWFPTREEALAAAEDGG